MSLRTTSLCGYIFLVLYDHGMYLFTFKKKSSTHALRGGVSKWHLSLPLMNNFNNTKAAIFLMQALCPLVFPFLSSIQYKIKALDIDQRCKYMRHSLLL